MIYRYSLHLYLLFVAIAGIADGDSCSLHL